jgi:hypothetical protein
VPGGAARTPISIATKRTSLFVSHGARTAFALLNPFGFQIRWGRTNPGNPFLLATRFAKRRSPFVVRKRSVQHESKHS